MALLFKAIYRYNKIHDIFHRIGTNNPKIYMENERFRIARAILGWWGEVRGNKATVVKPVWYWYKNRDMAKWNRESPEINPHPQSIFDKGGRSIKWEKDRLLSKWCRESWTATCKSLTLEHTLTSRPK